MTIEEKAKAFDEALQKAKEWKSGVAGNGDINQCLDELFPELAESEDEKIRKHLIWVCNDWVTDGIADRYETKSIKIDDMLRWLEKKGEQKQEEIWPNLSNCLHDCKKCTGKCLYRKEEYQGEQKPVTPKFKVGDWIQPKDKHYPPCLIKSIEGDIVKMKAESDLNDNVEKLIYLEEGWELVEQKPVEWTDDDNWNMQVFLNALDLYKEPVDKQILKSWFKSLKNKTFPQKTEWSEKDEKMYQSALWHIKNSCGNGGKNSGEFEVYHFVKSLKDRCLPQLKREWGEEDERMLSCAQEAVKAYFSEIGNKGSVIYWLNSLKDRILPRPRQEWSKEDTNILNGIIAYLSCHACDLEGFDRWYDWLKHLSPQTKHELSEEYIEKLVKAYSDSLPICGDFQSYHDALVDSYRKGICVVKQINSQKQWKPSGEQMEAVEKALSLAKNCGEEYSFDLRTLLENLKAL